MWARGFAVLILSAGLASAQVTKSATKTPTPKAQPAPPPANTARAVPPPKDESGRDKALPPFLAKLKDVLKRKDRVGLQSLLADDVAVGARGMVGPSAFYTAWDLGDPDSSIYGVLTQILSLNGVWAEQKFCAPYVVASFPADLDRAKNQVVLNPNISVRAAASATSRVVATLSYEIVEVLERGEWTKIKTQAGVTGYLPIAYLYSPSAYRACFAKNAAGEWRLQELAAGK